LKRKPKLGPWARVVEVAAWFDKGIAITFLNEFPTTVLRTRFLELVEEERRGVLQAVAGTPLFERLSRLTGVSHLPLSKMLPEEVRALMDTSALTRGIVVDDGAVAPVTTGRKNLLPPGIVSVSGMFEAGEIVSILSRAGQQIGFAVSEYSSTEIDLIKGFHSSQIPEILGQSRSCEVVYRRQLCAIGTTDGK
jgi:predicted ribosome-associated RNA-binding protein Tma20